MAHTRYFVSSYGHLIKATKYADELVTKDTMREVSKEEYDALVLEENQRLAHIVKSYLNWDTFQALCEHAKSNKLKPGDLASGIIKQYYQDEQNKLTKWSAKEQRHGNK